MKKLTLLLILSIATMSCSNDNCDEEIKSINEKYDAQIQQVKDNPGPTGPDYRQIGLLNDERDKKLNNACN